MADLLVTPSLQLKETDILTVDKLNLMATPVVELSIETPVTDENFFRNGNFYSSFWVTPAGISCPVGAETSNANYWTINPNGAPVTCLRSTNVPDLFSLWSLQLTGAVGTTDCSFAQQINGDLSATLRRACTWSGYIYNNTGAVLSPTLEIWTANAFNNFNTVTLQSTVNLQSVAVGAWGYDTVTIDLSASTFVNVANGLLLKVRIPNGALSATTKIINFSRVKFQLGEVATQFVDDPSLFIQTPSVDSTMLQDGCIARPSLFLPEVIPAGAYQGGSIQGEDIAANTVAASNLAAGAVTGSLGYTPVNKGGDTGVGIIEHDVDTVVGSGAAPGSGVYVKCSSTNASNDGYFPAIGFGRPGVKQRAVGLDINARFKTVDGAGTIGFLLDTVTGVDTNSYQTGSITLAALSQSLVNLLIPPGEIRGFGGPNLPTGWIACDGSQYLQTQFPGLFAAIGSYWGSGGAGASAWFAVPDLRGRSPLGYVNTPITGITSRPFATTGGEETHVLSTGELATHNHNFQDPGHLHVLDQTPHWHSYYQPTGTTVGVTGGAQPIQYAAGSLNTTAANANITMENAMTNITIQPVGNNQGHNNLQPFAVIFWMIKT